ncbi:MAG: hypothetical protein J6386_00355 [Candidatus Synoicihabitans palmerolidicus]|nr:hypothetical protein [Candidatus Synoicihabitans palmerolidicus]
MQNFLIKPYNDEVVFREITKAMANPWRSGHFEEEAPFWRTMGYERGQLHERLAHGRKSAEAAPSVLLAWSEAQGTVELLEEIAALLANAEAAGARGIVEALGAVEAARKAEQWSLIPRLMEPLKFGARLIEHRLEPTIVCEGFLTEAEVATEAKEKAYAEWIDAPREGRCPVMKREHLEQQVDALPGCPVIDSAAASFQMTANGHPSCINPLMDLVARDPGLSVQMLIAANQAHSNRDDDWGIEDAKLAVGQLGEKRLAAQGRGLITISKSVMDVPPGFNWSEYWIFQRGVARIAQEICR